VTQKSQASYFRDITGTFYPILLILGKAIPPEDVKQNTYAQPTTYSYIIMFALYFVKTSFALEHTLRRWPLSARLFI